MNPAPPLLAAADLSSHSEAKRQQHLLERATVIAQHYSNSQVHGTNAGLSCLRSCRFPLAADLRKESCAGRTPLIQNFSATTTVVSNCRSTNERRRQLLSFRQRSRQVLRAHDATLANPGLLRFRPASSNAFTREVDHSIKSGDKLWRDRAHRIPADFMGACSSVTHQTVDFVAL